jgi:DNA-binding CsgD family transcriptional regulator
MPIKPTLGFSNRTDAVIALRGQGLRTTEIATRIGIEPKTVTALEASAARSKSRAKRPAEEQGRTVVFPIDVLNGLRRPAERRGIHPNHLARLLIEAVVDGDLVDAVLDDADCLDDYAPLRRGRV